MLSTSFVTELHPQPLKNFKAIAVHEVEGLDNYLYNLIKSYFLRVAPKPGHTGVS